MPNSCLNCRFARWQMTAHTPPRLKNQVGRCTYATAIETLPIPAVVDRDRLVWLLNPSSQRGIRHDRPHTDCPVWAAADEPT